MALAINLSRDNQYRLKMISFRNSYFFRRMIRGLLLVLLIWAFATNLFYTIISRKVLIENKGRDLLPQAEWIADRSALYFVEGDPFVYNLVNVSYNFFNVWTFIYFADNSSLETPLPSSFSEESIQEIREAVQKVHMHNMSGEESEPDYGTIQMEGLEHGLLYVVAPIYSPHISDQTNLPIGTVILVQPLAEFYLSVASLNVTLLIVTLITGILMLIPAILWTRHLMVPINHIREVAVAISEGNFNQVVDITPDSDGEIGDLARAINHMSETIAESLQELSLERNQLKEIIDGINEGIIAVDRDCSITQINNLVWELFQLNPNYYSAEDLLQTNGLDDLLMQCLSEGQPVIEQIQIEGAKIIIQCSISPVFDHTGQISAAVGLFRDVTQAERLEQTRREYVANISHELRTPITGMRALIEPLKDGMVKTEESRQRYYEIIYRETLRLSRLIDDMLELSRLQAGSTSIEQGPINLEDLFLDLSEHFSFLVTDHKIKYVSKRPEGELPLIWGNEDRIEQILLTYVDNAIKFTAEEGTICFRLRLTEQEAILEIEDTGSGIKPEDLPYVFERFYKADKAHNEKGTGLGLSIAKALADQLNMSVFVRSTRGQGSCFSLAVQFAAQVMQSDEHMKEVFDADEKDTVEAPGSVTSCELHKPISH